MVASTSEVFSDLAMDRKADAVEVVKIQEDERGR